jgi:hypothetical protein
MLQNFYRKSRVHYAQDAKNSNQHVQLTLRDLHLSTSGWCISVPFTGLLFYLVIINEDSRFLPSNNLGYVVCFLCWSCKEKSSKQFPYLHLVLNQNV